MHMIYDIIKITKSCYYSVLRRMVSMMIATATLIADVDASQRQAQSATAAARQLMENQDNKVRKQETSYWKRQIIIYLFRTFLRWV